MYKCYLYHHCPMEPHLLMATAGKRRDSVKLVLLTLNLCMHSMALYKYFQPTHCLPDPSEPLWRGEGCSIAQVHKIPNILLDSLMVNFHTNQNILLYSILYNEKYHRKCRGCLPEWSSDDVVWDVRNPPHILVMCEDVLSGMCSVSLSEYTLNEVGQVLSSV